MRYIALFIALIQCCFASDITQNIKRVMIQADWIAHVVCVSNDTKYDTPHKDEKYDETKMRTIAVAISDAFTNSGAFKGKKKGDFITFKDTEPRNYTASNWNAIYLWNWLFAYKTTTESTTEDLIKYTSNLIKENCKDIQNIESKISKAQSDFEYYHRELKMFEFLNSKVKNGEYNKLSSLGTNGSKYKLHISNSTIGNVFHKIIIGYLPNEDYLDEIQFGGIKLYFPSKQVDTEYVLYDYIKSFEPLHNITYKESVICTYRNSYTSNMNKGTPQVNEKKGVFRYGECSNNYVRFETNNNPYKEYTSNVDTNETFDITGFKLTNEAENFLKGMKYITIAIPARIHKRNTRVSLKGLIKSVKDIQKTSNFEIGIAIKFEQELIKDSIRYMIQHSPWYDSPNGIAYSRLIADDYTKESFAGCKNLILMDMAGTVICDDNQRGMAQELFYEGMFKESGLQIVRMPRMNKGTYIKTTKEMFKGCNQLTQIYDLDFLNVRLLKTMESMFEGCKNIKEIKFTMDQITSTYEKGSTTNAFKGATALQNVYLPQFTAEEVIEDKTMFAGCDNLKEENVHHKIEDYKAVRDRVGKRQGDIYLKYDTSEKKGESDDEYGTE